jgi:PAS domain S-box-containing protein
MKKVLKVLIIEDSEDDSLLVLNLLKKGSFDVIYERIDTRTDLEVALKKNWDIILSDYTMPHFTGLEALKLVKEKGIDIPFIIISGAIGEETAVEAMRNGAHDYVMKNNMYRLLPAIERELRESKIRAESRLLETKRIEAEVINESEKKLRNLLRELPVGVLLYNSQAQITFCNNYSVELLGVNKEQIIGKTIYDADWNFIGEDGSPIPWQLRPVAQAINIKQAIHGRVLGIYRNKHDDLIWLLVDALPNMNEDRSVKQVVCTLIDITQRKNAEEKLVKLNKAVEQSPVSIIVTDLMGSIEYANPFCSKNTGYNYEEIIGKNPKIFKSGVTSVEVYKKLWKTISNGIIWRGELCNKKKNGELYWESVSISPVTNSEGQITHYIGIKEDVTKQKMALKALKESESSLKKLNAEKDRFFSIIAHDLRSPFSSLLGISELMVENLQRLSKNEIEDFAIHIRNSATKTYQLLENLLEWAKNQSGLIPFKPELLIFNSIAEDCILILQEQLQSKGISITSDIPSKFELFADKNMLLAVIRNLISNAIKFTPKGGKIKIGAIINQNGDIEISVDDTGIGMSKDLADNLFRIDFKTSRPGTDGETSSGFGLLLCKDFIEKHSGQIWVKSDVGIGTTFFFTIPKNETHM